MRDPPALTETRPCGVIPQSWREGSGCQPLCELDGDALRPGNEHELAIVKLHDVIAHLDAGCGEFRHRRFDIVNREAHVIESQSVELPDVRVGHRVRAMPM